MLDKGLMKVIFEKEINRCYSECPYFGVEGGPGPIMVCNHPKADNLYIISHPECDSGFPDQCPLKLELLEAIKKADIIFNA